MEENKQRLETCLAEFYGSETSNRRKHEIESLLQHFIKTRDSWRQALFCYGTDSTDYVTMYSQSILEYTIKTRWTSLSSENQSEIKSSLYNCLHQKTSASSPTKCPGFIRNKGVKLICDIGKHSWPHQDSRFFSNVLQMLQNPDTVILGLSFIKTISEEWTNIGDELSTKQKLELKAHLTKEIPSVFTALEAILNAGVEHTTGSSTGQDHIDEVISLALEVSTHLCSWVTLDGSVQGQVQGQEVIKVAPFQLSFVQLLCRYAVMDFHEVNPTSNPLSPAHKSLNVLNELCYRKYIPKEFEKQIHFITHFGIEILNKLINPPPSAPPVPEMYLDKVIEFLCLIASSHFNQYDEQSAKALLSLLLPFTFGQTLPHFYYECLEIWARVLDHVNTHLPIISQLMNRDDYVDIYKQPILALANGIVHSTAKYQVTESERDEDCVDLEDDDVTTTPRLSRNVDILVKVGEILPTESLESLLTTWTDSCRYFGSLQTLLDPTSKRLMNLENKVELEHFHFIVQILGRMASVFYGDVFKQEVSLGKSLFQQLVGVYNFSQRFYFVKDCPVVTRMNCEIVSALSLWTCWLQRFHSEVILAESTLEDQQTFFEVLGILTEVVFFGIEHLTQIEPKVVEANVNFFLTLVTTVRTQFIFQISSVQTLVQRVYHLKDSTTPEVYRVLNKIVAAVFLLPWQSVSQQEWETRTRLYESHMKVLLEEFARTATSPSNVVMSITLLQDQLDLLVSESSPQSRRICWNVMKEVVPFLHSLAETYLRQPSVSQVILSLFSKIMEVLRQQAGAPFFETTIQSFLNLFSSSSLIRDLVSESDSASVVLEKFLQMLQYIVKDPSPSFKKFLADTLSLCYDQIYPALCSRANSVTDLRIPFFTLIRDTVIYRWNYFFPPLLLQARTSTSSVTDDESTVVVQRFDQIVTSIGNSFVNPDTSFDVFRFNLNTLSSWNDKHGFYTKVSTGTRLEFVRVLMQLLVEKRHELYRDEMTRVLHDLVSVDYVEFRTTFLEGFITSNFHSIGTQEKGSLVGKFCAERGAGGGQRSMEESMDFPTFSLILNGFVDDLRHFQFLVESKSNSEMQQGNP